MSDLVTLAEAQAVVGITAPLAATKIQAMLDAVEAWVARRLYTAFRLASGVELVDGGVSSWRPRWSPVRSVTSAVDTSDGSSVSASLFTVRAGRVWYMPGGALSSLPGGFRRYQVTLAYGYNDGDESPAAGSESAPEGLKIAILGLVSRLLNAPGGQTAISAQGASESLDQLPTGEIEALLSPFDAGRRVW